MNSTEDPPIEIPGMKSILMPNPSSRQTQQEYQTASPKTSVAIPEGITKERNDRIREIRQEQKQPFKDASQSQKGSLEASSHRAQGKREGLQPLHATIPREDHSQERDQLEHKKPVRASSTPVGEIHHHAPSSATPQLSVEQYTRMEIYYKQVELQNTDFRNQIKRNQVTEASLKAQLADAHTHRDNLEQRLEEASNTIFRLRPQREEYTEGEIQEDYEKLIKLVKNWVNVNCESFLDDDLCGLDTLGRRDSGANPGGFEAMIRRFHSRPDSWTEAKEDILVAVVMRYVFDHILNPSFSVLLRHDERELLASIQTGMENMELQKDLITIRTWRSDTVNAINSPDGFSYRYPSIRESLTTRLNIFLQGAISREDSESAMRSLLIEVVTPGLALAYKTQSASSIWKFKYSDYFDYQPGEFAYKMPRFLEDVHHFRCINMSKRGKPLKPATDLTTKEQQENLRYVLDIFPGLTCQRVTAVDSQPLSMVVPPTLLVAFTNRDAKEHTQRAPPDLAGPETSHQSQNLLQSWPQPKRRSRGFMDTLKDIF